MLTVQEFENVLSLIRLGSGLRDAISSQGKHLDVGMQKWFQEDFSREKAYLAAKKEFEDSRK